MLPRHLALPLLLLSAVAVAAPYRHAGLGLAVELPDGWRTRAAGGALRVLPPKVEDRERSGVGVRYWREPMRGKGALEKLAASYRKPRGGREAASRQQLNARSGRLVLEYREGEYVQSGLWIVRRHLRVVQRDGNEALFADCVANASEFHRYRKPFTALCLAMDARPRGKGAK